MSVQALVAEAAIEAFDDAVLHRLAGGDVMPFDLGLLTPFEDGHAGHLRAVVRDDRLRLPPPDDKGVQLAGKPSARQGCVGDQAQAFAGEVIDGSQDAEAATVSEGIAEEGQDAMRTRPNTRTTRLPRAKSSDNA